MSRRPISRVADHGIVRRAAGPRGAERQAREIATVAILAALGGAEGPLAAHTAAALHNGVDASELLALLEHVSVYAGMPRALGALRVVGDALSRARLPSPATLTTVAVGDHETVVASRGESGPPVVLLHALGLDWRMWDAVMVSLARSRRVFAYDIRGHGRAAGSPVPFTMDDAAADLVAVLDALALDRAHVVGLSYGGGIAQTAAIHHPERFASLALLATTDFPFDAFEVRARSGETDGMEAQIVPSLTRWFTPAALAVDAWGVRYAREQVRRADPRDWAPRGGHSSASTSGVGWRGSGLRRWSWPESSTPPPRRRSCPRSPRASTVPSTGNCQEPLT